MSKPGDKWTGPDGSTYQHYRVPPSEEFGEDVIVRTFPTYPWYERWWFRTYEFGDAIWCWFCVRVLGQRGEN